MSTIQDQKVAKKTNSKQCSVNRMKQLIDSPNKNLQNKIEQIMAVPSMKRSLRQMKEL